MNYEVYGINRRLEIIYKDSETTIYIQIGTLKNESPTFKLLRKINLLI